MRGEPLYEVSFEMGMRCPVMTGVPLWKVPLMEGSPYGRFSLRSCRFMGGVPPYGKCTRHERCPPMGDAPFHEVSPYERVSPM